MPFITTCTSEHVFTCVLLAACGHTASTGTRQAEAQVWGPCLGGSPRRLGTGHTDWPTLTAPSEQGRVLPAPAVKRMCNSHAHGTIYMIHMPGAGCSHVSCEDRAVPPNCSVCWPPAWAAGVLRVQHGALPAAVTWDPPWAAWAWSPLAVPVSTAQLVPQCGAVLAVPTG